MKKIIGLALAAVALISLSACGSSKSSESQLDAVKKAGVLKVATSADYAPFEFHTMVDGKDKIVGADVDLVNEIAKELGVKAEVSDMSFNTVLASLKEGKSDIAVSAISATPERKEQFNFSNNYYNPPQVVIINKKNESTIKSIADLKDKNVGAQKGSIQEDVIKTQMKDAKPVSIDKVPNMIVEVSKGSLDGMVVEKTIAESYVQENPELMIAPVKLKASKEESFAIALPKEDNSLQKEINKIIKKLIDEGKIDQYVKDNHELAEKSAE